MAYLTVAVALSVALSLLNLLLAVAVLRTLRARPAPAADEPPFDPDQAVADLRGRPVPAFHATSTTGERVTGSDVSGRRTLIGFFSGGCPACREEAPRFARLVATLPDRPDVLAVVGGDPAETAGLVRDLTPTATVVTEPELGPVAAAFGITGFPTFLRTDDTGTVVTAALSLYELDVTPASSPR